MTKECSCAFSTVDLVFNTNTISRTIRRSKSLGKPIPLEIVKTLVDNINNSIIDIDEIKNACNINIDKQKENLNIIKNNILKINEPDARKLIDKNLDDAVTGIRNTLNECKTKP